MILIYIVDSFIPQEILIQKNISRIIIQVCVVIIFCLSILCMFVFSLVSKSATGLHSLIFHDK